MSHLIPDQLGEFPIEIRRQIAKVERKMAERPADRERPRYAQLRAALERLEAGGCADCDGSIAVGHLFVFPEAVACGGCG